MLKKFLPIIIFLTASIWFIVPQLTYGQVVQLSFETGPQTIRPNQSSGPITVNAGQAAEATIYLTLETTSATGEFISCSSGNKAGSVYISRNTIRRSFCYRDSLIGSYTIKVSASTTLANNITPIEQEMIISENAPEATTTTAESDNDTEADKQNNSPLPVTNISGGYSAHASPAELSNLAIVYPSVSAGRKRLASLRTPIHFKAINGGPSATSRYYWNFGDGSSNYGQEVDHAYQFSGEYNIVLSAQFASGGEAVARTTVLITEPKLEITVDANQGFVAIRNDGGQEENINGWRLQASTTEFIFPQDTIISPRSSVKIPLSLTGINLVAAPILSFSYPDGMIHRQLTLGGQNQSQTISGLTAKLIEAKKQLAALRAVDSSESSLTMTESPINVVGIYNAQATKSAPQIITIKKDEGVLTRTFHFLKSVF